MNLDVYQNTYFIQQVALSAESFGVSSSDIATVGKALNSLFNVRCAANATVIPSQGPAQQSICIASDCPLAMNNTCSAYQASVEPGVSNSTLAMGEGNKTSTATQSAANGGTPTASSTSETSTGAAAQNVMLGGAAAAFAAAAYFL